MFYNFCKFILKIVFNVIYKLEVHGDTKLPNKPLIICANHISIWDPVVLAIIFDRKINFMGKKELFKNRIIAYLFKKAGVFPVDRENVNIKTIKYSINLLKNNEVLGIFPEGTRVKNVSEDNMKTGVAMIASRANCDVIPVYIKSDYKCGSKIDVFIRNKVVIQDFEDFPKENRNKAITKAIYNDIYQVN